MGVIRDREHEPPEGTSRDAADTLARTIVSGAAGAASVALGAADPATAVVVAGISASAWELLSSVFTTPIERRQKDWYEEIADAIRRLENERGIRPEDLKDNPAFIDAALSAYQSFIRTSQAEKRKALRNAVLNAALATPGQIKRHEVFLALVDRFTTTHLALLSLLHYPRDWRGPDGKALPMSTTGSARVVVLAAFSDAEALWPLYEQAWSDLYAAGLVRTPRIENGGEGPPIEIRRTTDVGKEFLKFITSPVSE